MTTNLIWDRENIESLKGHERPSVRCRVEVKYVDQDGRAERGTKDTSGKIELDGNNPWVTCWMGEHLAHRISWGLLLEILNEPHSPPLWINQDRPVELET